MLFARYAELLGAGALEVPAPADATVADIVSVIRRLPGGDSLPARLLCAVNLRQSLPSDPVAPGDEVALLPPLSGG